jgi:NitT/TauT family transport system substrate-binding protein
MFLEADVLDRNQTIAILVVAIVIGSLGVVVIWNLPPSEPTTTIRIGYLSKDLHQLALQVALENGLFDRDNITVELVQYGNGALEMDGFLAGQIDMGYLGAAPALLKRINQDIMITILAAVNMEGSTIMVSKSEYEAGHVTSIADLAGKGVFHPGPATVQNLLLRLALNQSGLSYDIITATTMSPTYMADSLSAENPAFIAWEPFNAKSEYENKSVPLVTSGEIWPGHPCCVLAADNSYLSANPDIVQKVVNIHIEATEWIVNNPTQAIAIATDWLEMDITPVTTAFNNIIYDWNLNRTGLEMYLDFLIDEEQLISEKIPADPSAFLDDFINTTYASSFFLLLRNGRQKSSSHPDLDEKNDLFGFRAGF